MKNLNTTPASRLSLFKLFWHFVRSAPLPFAVNILLRLVNAGNRGFQPVVIAGFTNALINAKDLELWCGVYLVLISLDLLSDVLNTTTQMWFSNKAVLYFQQRLLRQVTEIPLLHFLEPDFHDNLNRATHGFSPRITNWFQSLLGNVYSIVSICGLFGSVLVLGGGVKCLLVLLVSSLIIFLTRIPIARLELARDRSTAYLNRTQDAWAAHLYERDSAPEVRLFSIQHWILSKWKKAYKHLADIDMEVLKGKTRWNLLATLSSVIGYSAIIFLAAHTATAANEKEIAGVFTGLITAAVTLQGFLSYTAQAMGNLSEHSSVLRDLAPLFTTPPPKTEKHQDNALPDPGIQAEMNTISFQYPRATTQTLKHITAKIDHGEVVALVGKNGAGKTTLANLLLGLYTPDTGTLKFSENTDNGTTRSAVFQNFVRYRLPVRDNIGLADINHIENDARIQHMLEKVDSTFAHELDTWLGHEFGGRDASDGEWLRIAVARGLFRESSFIVFDEPTAAIDPVAEIEMIRTLLTKNKSCSTLIISHRLGVARLCDRILVLDAGQLVENGTHEELLAQNGLYADMWNAQASWYA